MDAEEIKRAIIELERTSQSHQHFIRIAIPNGGGECVFEGNPAGYRLLAASVLRFSLSDEEDDLEEPEIHEGDILDESSDFHIENYLKAEGPSTPELAEELTAWQRNFGMVADWFFLALVFTIPIFWFIGIVASIIWFIPGE